MPTTPSTLRPDEADTIRDVAFVAGQLEELLAATVPLLTELQRLLVRISEQAA